MAVTARGLAKAAEILAGQFTLVATNVPYLGHGKQDEILKNTAKESIRMARPTLATCFVERCLGFCAPGGTAAPRYAAELAFPRAVPRSCVERIPDRTITGIWSLGLAKTRFEALGSSRAMFAWHKRNYGAKSFVIVFASDYT